MWGRKMWGRKMWGRKVGKSYYYITSLDNGVFYYSRQLNNIVYINKLMKQSRTISKLPNLLSCNDKY